MTNPFTDEDIEQAWKYSAAGWEPTAATFRRALATIAADRERIAELEAAGERLCQQHEQATAAWAELKPMVDADSDRIASLERVVEAAHFLLCWHHRDAIDKNPPLDRRGWRITDLHPSVRDRLDSGEQNLWDALASLPPDSASPVTTDELEGFGDGQ